MGNLAGAHSQEARPGPQKCQFPFTVVDELGLDLFLDPMVIQKCCLRWVLVALFLSTPILAWSAACALGGKWSQSNMCEEMEAE